MGEGVFGPKGLLSSFSFDHVRQIGEGPATLMTCPLARGSSPRNALMAIDLDSTNCEVHPRSPLVSFEDHADPLGDHPVATTPVSIGEVEQTRDRYDSTYSR